MIKSKKTIDIWITDDGVEHLDESSALLHLERLSEQKALNDIQQMNQMVRDAQAAQVQQIKNLFEKFPEIKQDFLNKIKKSNEEGMQRGADQGWWPSWDEKGPRPWPWELRLSDFKPHETMAHALVQIGVFESVGDARRNGWNKPITTGEWWFKKKTVHLIIKE